MVDESAETAAGSVGNRATGSATALNVACLKLLLPAQVVPDTNKLMSVLSLLTHNSQNRIWIFMLTVYIVMPLLIVVAAAQ